MKLSTYIKAHRKASEQANYLFSISLAQVLRTPKMPQLHKELRLRRQAQADKFFTRAVQLADEQHDLIVTQEAQLDQFAQALQEVAK